MDKLGAQLSMSAALLGLVSAAATHRATTGETAKALAGEHFAIPGGAGGPQMALSLQSQHHLAHLRKNCVFLVARSEARARARSGAPGGRFWASVAALVALLAGPLGARCLETAARGWSNQLHSLPKNRAAAHFDKDLLPAVSEVAGRRSRCSLSAISCMRGIRVLLPKSVSNTSGWA